MRALATLLMCSALALGVGSGCSAPATAGLVVIPPEQRVMAPEVVGLGLRGGTVDLADFRGQAVVVNAFASWCPPCQQELPLLARLHDGGLMVLGLDVKDVPEAARGTLDAVEARFPVIQDPRGDLLSLFHGPTQGIPQSILIDEQGRVAGYLIGPADADTLRAIRDVLLPRGQSPGQAPPVDPSAPR